MLIPVVERVPRGLEKGNKFPVQILRPSGVRAYHDAMYVPLTGCGSGLNLILRGYVSDMESNSPIGARWHGWRFRNGVPADAFLNRQPLLKGCVAQ